MITCSNTCAAKISSFLSDNSNRYFVNYDNVNTKITTDDANTGNHFWQQAY